MNRFEDGPAAGHTLQCRHSPIFLRATEEGDKWDCLDAPEDEPELTETIHVYVRRGQPVHGFIDGAQYRGPFSMANYRYYLPQPPDATLRDNAKWQQWCQQQEAQLFA